jgi:hypothetical protein
MRAPTEDPRYVALYTVASPTLREWMDSNAHRAQRAIAGAIDRTQRTKELAKIRALIVQGRGHIARSANKTHVAAVIAAIPSESQLADPTVTLAQATDWRYKLQDAVERYDMAGGVGPGNWTKLVQTFTSNPTMQRTLSAWLDTYARTGKDAEALLNGWENAKVMRGEVGRKGTLSLAQIARDLNFAPKAPAPRVKVPTLYHYGSRRAPFGGITAPKGAIRTEPPHFGPSHVWNQLVGDPYHKVIYDRPLTEYEIQQYELVPYMPADKVIDELYRQAEEHGAGAAYAEDIRNEGSAVFEHEFLRPRFADLNVYTDAVFFDNIAQPVIRRLLAAYPAP